MSIYNNNSNNKSDPKQVMYLIGNIPGRSKWKPSLKGHSNPKPAGFPTDPTNDVFRGRGVS